VAVIDTDIDLDHLDLDQNISAASIDIVINNYATVNDVNGHGAQVAGIIAAEENDLAMHGVAYGATVLAVRADALCFPVYTPACRGFNDTDLADALDYAVAQGAGVINLSLGGTSPQSSVFTDALLRAANPRRLRTNSPRYGRIRTPPEK
jgi:subtilisin family serine protease